MCARPRAPPPPRTSETLVDLSGMVTSNCDRLFEALADVHQWPLKPKFSLNAWGHTPPIERKKGSRLDRLDVAGTKGSAESPVSPRLERGNGDCEKWFQEAVADDPDRGKHGGLSAQAIVDGVRPAFAQAYKPVAAGSVAQ